MVDSKKRKGLPSFIRWVLWVLLVQFILVNISAAFYAHRLTHFFPAGEQPAPSATRKNIFKKTWTIFRGPKIYKLTQAPADTPRVQYKKLELTTSGKLKIQGWWLMNDTAKGTVLVFHGLTGNRVACLGIAQTFYAMGYNALLIDFRGHGQSEGAATNYGFRETEEVKLLYDYAVANGCGNIFLWGMSMGGSTIIKAMHDYPMQISGLIADAPFASLQQHLKGRAEMFGLPRQPFAFLVTAWISIERGFNAYGYNVANYATSVRCPVLLQWGEKDILVKKEECDRIFEKLATGNKKKVVYENAGHEILLENDPATWLREVNGFLEANKK